MTCTPYQRAEQIANDPILVVEILSPSTERHDRHSKVPAYREIDSVNEILMVDSHSIYAEILKREGDRWITEPVRGPSAELRLSSVDRRIPMAELYEGIDVDSENAA
jgi:Uma2 family endonuclease